MKKNRWILVLSVVIIALGILAVAKVADKPKSELEDLPNYTDVKQPIVVDGFQYEKQPRMGDPEAKVKVIEFSDFKCPGCKKWTETIFDRFKQEYVDTGKVELFYMNYAFLDRDSYMAAQAGEAIAKQSSDKFWEYKKLIYEYQGDEGEIWATRDFLVDLVEEHMEGIDMDRFKQELKENKYLYDVKEDYKIGGFYGVNGTPQFMVNGKLLRSMDYEALKAAVELELGR